MEDVRSQHRRTVEAVSDSGDGGRMPPGDDEAPPHRARSSYHRTGKHASGTGGGLVRKAWVRKVDPVGLHGFKQGDLTLDGLEPGLNLVLARNATR